MVSTPFLHSEGVSNPKEGLNSNVSLENYLPVKLKANYEKNDLIAIEVGNLYEKRKSMELISFIENPVVATIA
ncbi:hypothetical protein RIR_jg31573.t1 [Rhizophagus irregularis DAOM 181602=DAOM 197198]|nr:hypothetical protein RIR_jg31573.t1 [Rhizophagus irregularis DAOM 181602=DAOM 197198]